jgi:hypothetical protein
MAHYFDDDGPSAHHLQKLGWSLLLHS